MAFLLSLTVPHLSFLFFGFICAFLLSLSVPHLSFLFFGFICGVSFVIICSPSLIPFFLGGGGVYMWRFFCHYLFLISHFFSLVSYVKLFLSLFVPHLSFLFFGFICEVSFVIICSLSLILCFMIVAFPMYLLLHFIV